MGKPWEEYKTEEPSKPWELYQQQTQQQEQVNPAQPYIDQAQQDSGLQNFMAGVGGGMEGLYLGAKDILGQASPEEIEQYKQSMEGLDSTAGGFLGNITGQALPLAVAGGGTFGGLAKLSPKIAGLTNSALGRATLAGTSGSAQGALIPTNEDESRLLNTIQGGFSGFLMSPILDKGASVLSKYLQKKSAVKAQEALRNDPNFTANIDVYLQQNGVDLSGLSEQAKQKAREFAAEAMQGNYTGDLKALERQAVLESLPVPIKGTRGQLTQDFGNQDNERSLADVSFLGFNNDLRKTFEDQRSQLAQNFDSLIKEQGGTAKSVKEAGESLQNAGLSRYELAKKMTGDAYKEAESIAGNNIGKPDQGLIDWFNKNRGFQDVKGLITQAKELGIIKTNKQGRVVEGEAPLRNFYELRKTISRLSQNNGGLADAKGLVDKTFDDYGGDAYRVAAGLRRKQGETFESGSKAVQDLVQEKATSTDLKTDPEEVFNRFVLRGNSSGIRDIKNLLTSGDEAQKRAGEEALNNIKAQTIAYIKDSAVKDVNGKANFTVAGLDNAIKKIGDENLKEILGKESYMRLNDLVKASEITQKQQSSMARGSPTASRLVSLLNNILDIAEKVPVAGSYVKAVGNVGIKSAQTRNAVKDTATAKISKDITKKTVAKNAGKLYTVGSLLNSGTLQASQEE